jgi:integrase
MPSLILTKKNIDAIDPPTIKTQELYWDPTLGGFGLLVGRPDPINGIVAKTFVLQKKDRRRKIGRYGPWTPDAARKYASELIVGLDKGEDPYAERRRQEARGILFSQAINEYIARLRSKGGSDATIADVQEDTGRLLRDWLPRPLAEITKDECRTRHRQITGKKGPYAANIVFRYFRAIYNVALKCHDLPAANPTIGIDWNKAERRQEPIAWANLPAWRETVDALSPVLRDYLYVVLLTGLRSEDAATIRWDDLDLVEKTLHRPCPKGGEDRAFTIPLSTYTVELLRRRKEESQDQDEGWVFPTKSRGGKVIPIVLRRWGRKRSQSPHRLRDSFSTACAEVGLSSYDIDVLTNHRPPKGSVTAGYIRQDLEHLRTCQEAVTDFILKKLK